jgi:mRNA interferase MazF
MVMTRGEIWWADMPAPAKSEPGYRRPVLIIQSDDFNQSKINTVICIVLTSNIRLAQAPGNILLQIKESNLLKNSVINVSQIITLDKSFLSECAGSVSEKTMTKVEMGIKLVLGID